MLILLLYFDLSVIGDIIFELGIITIDAGYLIK